MESVKNNELRIEVGRTWVWAEEIQRMQNGSTVELEDAEDSDMSLYYNGHLVAKGQPVVVEGNIGIQVTEVVETEVEREMQMV